MALNVTFKPYKLSFKIGPRCRVWNRDIRQPSEINGTSSGIFTNVQKSSKHLWQCSEVVGNCHEIGLIWIWKSHAFDRLAGVHCLGEWLSEQSQKHFFCTLFKAQTDGVTFLVALHTTVAVATNCITWHPFVWHCFVLKTSRIFSISLKVGGKQQKRTHTSATDWRARNLAVQL